MQEQSNDEFLSAMATMNLYGEVVFEYRVYYDPITKSCILKTISSADGEYVIVTAEEYEQIEFCPNYYVTDKGTVKRKNFDFTSKKLLQLSTTGEYTSLRHNNIFVCAPGNNCDFWRPKTYD